MLKFEIKKILSNKVMLGFWILILVIAYISIRIYSINDTYADLFLKLYDLVPAMGLIIFGMVSNSYSMEENSNTKGIVLTTRYGHKTPIYKFLGASIVTSIMNLAILGVLLLNVITHFNFKGLNMPIRAIWYFKMSNINISIMQMLLIVSLTIMMGSFLFSGLALILSIKLKSSILPFILGGVIMGFPYLTCFFLQDKVIFTPTLGMISSAMVARGATTIHYIIQIIVYVMGLCLVPIITTKEFNKKV